VKGAIIIHQTIKSVFEKFSIFSLDRISYLIVPVLSILLCLHSAIVSFPEKISFYGDRYWNMDNVLKKKVKESGIHNAIVFIRSGYFREGEAAPNYYGAGFIENDIELKNDVIYARDFGDEEDMKLMKLFPQRKAYRFVYNKSLITANRYFYEETAPFLYPIPKPEIQISPRHLFTEFP
ncbi:MAG: hypothetical protein D6734_10825, partial [Candidatus Schekmanbacteria bacterium]